MSSYDKIDVSDESCSQASRTKRARVEREDYFPREQDEVLRNQFSHYLDEILNELEIKAKNEISKSGVKNIVKEICGMEYFLDRAAQDYSYLSMSFEPFRQRLKNLKCHQPIKEELKRRFERLGDDLYELVIDYLSFEEKIKLEYVSKQWQRLIYNKQNTLIITDKPGFDSNRLKLIKDSIIWINNLENVLKKAKFITKIVIDFDLSVDEREKVLKLISKYCPYLKSIKFNFNGTSDLIIETFAKNSGKTLTKIEMKLNNSKNLDKLYASCPLLKSINKFSINSLNDFNLVNKRLISLGLIFRPGDDLSKILGLLNNSAVELSITCNQSLKDSVVVQMIGQLSNLSNRAKKIKGLKLSFQEIDYKSSIDLLKSVEYFKELQKLQFYVFNVEESLQNNDNIQQNPVIVLSIESLRGLPLTQLSLGHPLINDEVFNEMSHFIPNLKVLSLCAIDTRGGDITDKALLSISKLKNLSKITISSFNDTMNGITDLGVMAIIKNCPKMNSIRIEVKSNIAHKITDALKALTLRKPPYISITS